MADDLCVRAVLLPPLLEEPDAAVDPAAVPGERRGRLTPAPVRTPPPTPIAPPTPTLPAAALAFVVLLVRALALLLPSLLEALHGPPGKDGSSLPGATAAAGCHHAAVGLLLSPIEVAEPGDSGASTSESERGRGEEDDVLDALLLVALLLLLSEEAVARWPRLWAAGGGASVNPFRLASSSLSKASYDIVRMVLHHTVVAVGETDAPS